MAEVPIKRGAQQPTRKNGTHDEKWEHFHKILIKLNKKLINEERVICRWVYQDSERNYRESRDSLDK